AFQRERARKQHRKAAGPILDKALRLHQAGIAREAQALCLQVLENLPDHFDALHLLGLSKSNTGELVEAEAILQRALQVDPKSAELLSNLGVVQSDMGQIEKARASYEKAIALRPNSPIALNNLGNALFKLNLPERAIQAFDRALSYKPDYIDAVYNRGNALLFARRLDEALATFERVIQMKPLYALAHNAIGLTYLELKRFDEALTSFDQAMRLKPDLPQALANRARALGEIGDIDGAFEHYSKARAIAPDLEAALLGHARLVISSGRLSEATDLCQRAVRSDPRSVEALTALAQCIAHQGKIDEAIELYDRALAMQPDNEGTITRKIFALDFHPRAEFPEHQQVRKQWWVQIGSKVPKIPAERLQNVRDPNRRLRIGYVSADFRDHSAAFVFGPVLRNHDKSVVEIFCYSCTSLRDSVTDDFQRVADKWVEAWRLTDDQLAEQIISDQIDILVDLSGFTGGHRLRVFARKPAPVQVTAWGHATGDGMPEIDYMFSDPVSTPAEVRHLFAEKIYDLPCLITIDAPPAAFKPALQPPCLTNGYVTFGVFNRVDKISADAIRIWSGILQAVPNSRLTIKHGALGDDAVRRRLMERFAAQGVAPDRILCLGPTTRLKHLEAYAGIDICLDPFPMNGGVSTWEALHAGVPVLAKLGNSNASRAAGAILCSAGLHEWVTDSESQYAERAIKYATQPDYLSELRAGLSAKILASQSGNTKNYTRAAEAAYRAIWQEYCAKRAGDGATS
ncbi:MAG: tetratricopeptide repeat protein, partial [Proteobacteria bacterium]|nr:tetratricopeptide repeat protein [Pseudomonadota bacterium]